MPRGTFRVGEDAFPLRQYVSRRVDVAVVVRTARRAVPRPHRQRQGVEPVPAGRAGLARRVEAADLDKGAPTLDALVLKQLRELAERGVRHSFRQMMVLHHALGIQILHAQDLVLVREHGRDLVKGIGSGIGNLEPELAGDFPRDLLEALVDSVHEDGPTVLRAEDHVVAAGENYVAVTLVLHSIDIIQY